MSDLLIYQGNDHTLDLTFDDGAQPTPAPINITGYTVYFTVKKKNDFENDDAQAVIQVDVTSHTNAAVGITEVPLTDTETDIDTGRYYYDIQTKDASGDITTVLVGELEIAKKVTKRTT